MHCVGITTLWAFQQGPFTCLINSKSIPPSRLYSACTFSVRIWTAGAGLRYLKLLCLLYRMCLSFAKPFERRRQPNYPTILDRHRLLLFSIMLAKLPFWAQIKNLRTRSRKPHKFVSYGRINTILSDSERLDVGLPEYIKMLRNI